MPDRDVKTIQDLIYYQYSKIVARRAFHASDGKEAKGLHYGFIKKTFRELKSGAKSWSEITREDRQFVEVEKRCIYCGAENDLHWEHIVPKSLLIRPQCVTCDIIQGIHNQIWACSRCNSSKGTKGLYEFYREKYPGERKFYDFIPPLLERWIQLISATSSEKGGELLHLLANLKNARRSAYEKVLPTHRRRSYRNLCHDASRNISSSDS